MNLQRKTLFILFAVLVTVACNPARKLASDQYLLNNNKIEIDNSSVSKDELKTLVKQKPNRKIFGIFRFHLWFYNLFDKEKIARKKAEWIKKTEKKNEERIKKGKKPISTDKLIGREKLQNIGEEPAILDSTLTERTRRQFEIYLFKKGFFNATVTDTTYYKKNHQADVKYIIHCNEPYLIRKSSFSSADSIINNLLLKDTAETMIHPGDRYDEDEMEKERERITYDFRNQGYYFFNKQFITIEMDSSLGTRQVDVYLYVNRVNENVDIALTEEIQPENHRAYTLRNIYIQTDYNVKESGRIPADTTFYNGYYFLNSGTDQFRKDALLRAVNLKTDSIYRQKDQEYTYTRLLDLNVFKFIKIIYTEVPRNEQQRNYLLDVSVQLSPSPKQDYTVEAEATHSGGNLGAAGSIGYRNKNTFKGAEALEIKLKGAAEALRNFNDSLTDKKLFFFNSFELGPEVNLNLKRWLFLTWFTQRNIWIINPKTNLSANFNYQSRPDYTRRILNGSFSYTSLINSVKHSVAFYIADVNSVRVDLSLAFRDKLTQTTDLNLLNSYSTHLTTASRLTYIYSNQAYRIGQSFFFIRANIEWAGFAVAPAISALLNEQRNSEGRKTITRIPFAQYVKPDFDMSFHQRLNQHNTLVYRLAAGVGIEGRNSTSLPFEKSFFAGGANSMRAWLAHTLGPGSYKNLVNIEQSGDIKFEFNIEERSSFVKWLEGAAFVDVGNIWTNHEDLARPGSQFQWGNYLNELGVGAGLGLRFDFSFFILRVDGAVKIHDPARDIDERWVYTRQKFALKDITPSLAIGYPF